MTEHHNDTEIEQILQKYRPAGPPEDLRRRVLLAADRQLADRSTGPWRVWGVRAAVAALLLLAIGLRIAPTLWVLAMILATPGKGF